MKYATATVISLLHFATPGYAASPILEEMPKTRGDKLSKASNRAFPDWKKAVSIFEKDIGVGKAKQIPSTVINVGDLRNIPYMSFRSAYYEFNIYGDPDKPAGVEVGIFKGNAFSDANKRKCYSTLYSIIGTKSERDTLLSLSESTRSKVASGYVAEITTPEAADSFGGWWITFYNTAEMEEARAKPEEMANIVERYDESAKAVASAIGNVAVSTKIMPPVSKDAGLLQEDKSQQQTWSNSDYAQARSSDTSSKTVYVRGYYRSSGTYVQPYSRRK